MNASERITKHIDDLADWNRIDPAALKDLVRAAVALNGGKPKRKTPTSRR